jgi:hypothetical protein
MSKEFSLGGNALTLATAAALTLVFLNPSNTIPSPMFNIMRLWASQSQTATSAMFQIQVETQASAFPTLTSATPRHLKTGDTVASLITGATTGAVGTCGINASAEGAGTKTPIWGDNFNNLNGYLWVPTPREVIEMAPGYTQGLGLYLATTPGAVAGWACGMNFAEGATSG